MKKTVWSAFLAFVLLAVSFSGCTPAITPTVVPTTVPSTVTLSPIPPTFTPEPPVIDESVKAAIGDAEYSEIKIGEVSGPDYISGSTFEGTVDAKNIKLIATNDTNNPYLVTAEATDNNGLKIKVFWNTDQNYWAKYVNINTNLLDYKNYTVFKNVFEMVANGDFNRYMSAIGIGAEAFPANTEQPRNWIVVNKHGVVGSDYVDYFLGS